MGALAKQVQELSKVTDGHIASLKAIAGGKVTDKISSGLRMGAAVIDSRPEAKGLGFARAVISKAQARLETDAGNPVSAIEMARRHDKAAGGIYGNRLEACVKALGESTTGGGGALSPDEFSTDFIELLRPATVLSQAGVRVIPMSGKISLSRARQASAAVATWKGENAPATYSQQTFDSPQINLKDLMCITAVSNDLLRDADISTEIVVRDDLVKVGLLALDLAGFRGLGTQFQPKGIRYYIPSANLNSAKAGAGTPTLSNAGYDFERSLTALLNGLNVPATHRSCILHPRTTGGLKLLTDSVGGFPIAREINEKGTIFGLKFFETTQIPINLSGGGSGGSSESEIYVFEAPEIEMGLGMSPTVEVSRDAGYLDGASAQQNAFTNDQSVIRMILRADWIMRHNFSAAVVQGATYGV